MLFQNNDDFFKAILSEMPGEIAVFDMQHRYVFVNPQAIQSAAIREWIVGKTDREYCLYRNIDLKVAEGRERLFDKVIREKREFEWEERMVDKLGFERIYMRRLSPIFDAFGDIVNLIGYGIEITERRKEKEELESSRNLLSQIINTSPQLIFIKDIDGRFLMVNQATADIFGMDIDSLIEKFNAEVHSNKAETDGYSNVDRQVITDRKNIRLEERFTKSDGTILWYDTIKVPFVKPDGTVLVLAISSEITERKEAELASEIDHQRMLEAQDLLLAGSWEINLQNGNIDWSPGMYKLLERDPIAGPLSVEDFLLMVNPDQVEYVRNSLDSLRDTGTSTDIQFEITLPSGVKVVRTRARVYQDEMGTPVRLFGIMKDVTAQKRTEALLRENEQRLIEAQELAKMGSWSFDPYEQKIEWSHGHHLIWERPLHLPPPSYPEYLESIHPDDRQRMIELSDLLIRKGQAEKNEYRLLFPDGRVKWIDSVVKLLKDPSGKVIKFFGTSVDITERKKFEQDLIEANIKAEASVRAKEIFLANVGHELRTPLNGVLGLSKLIQKTDLSPIQRNYIDILSRSAGNLLLIINDILDIAKIDSGTMTLERTPFNPGVVADTAVLTQQFKAEEKDLALRHIQEGNVLPNVIGDPLRLNQVLLNLLSNAIKFTEQGEVTLKHRVEEFDADHVIIEFSVTDTGIGIPQDMLFSIFDSFTQVPHVGTSMRGGTGLGLAITKNLVELQGGQISVESKLGEGSTFTFRIPYKKADDDNTVPSNALPEVDPSKISSLRILLAEDNPVNQFITQAMLLDWGFKVDMADNGLKALEMVKSNSYDLVLMDIQMPVMNGLEAAGEIRKLEDQRKARMPLIALTANTTKGAQKKFLSEGMNDCLVKPFKEEELLRVILSHLEGSEELQFAKKAKRFPKRKKPDGEQLPLYDLKLLYKDSNDDAAFVLRMLNLFNDTIPPIIEKMKAHFVAGEMDAISILVHKIKPTLFGVGIHSLQETITNMEAYREKKRTRLQMESDLEILEAVIARVTQAFAQEIEQLKN